jgi:hypothetical protein
MFFRFVKACIRRMPTKVFHNVTRYYEPLQVTAKFVMGE